MRSCTCLRASLLVLALALIPALPAGAIGDCSTTCTGSTSCSTDCIDGSLLNTCGGYGVCGGGGSSGGGCTIDTCATCARPSSSTAYGDSDGIPDPLEYDLAHRFFPDLRMSSFSKDVDETYFYRGLAAPYVIREYRTSSSSLCDESRECLEILFGLAYVWDHGDNIFGNAHKGDSEFYAALVRRTSSWPIASTSVSSWQLIRDFSAAHWGEITDSSKYGAYGYCPPNCSQWNYNQGSCQSQNQCYWFPGFCTGGVGSNYQSCSSYFDEGGCFFAGGDCQWTHVGCVKRVDCYNSYPQSAAVRMYAAIGKHATYHTDGECDAGALWADNCSNNYYSWRSYKGSQELQNVGNSSWQKSIDTKIQHPNLCSLYDVWSGAGFANSSDYKSKFEESFGWSLP